MSIKYMSLVWPLPLRPVEKLLLMALADNCNDEGTCWPSIKTLAKKASLDERTTQRKLRLLASKGLLKIEKRFRKDGSQMSNFFVLTLRGGNLPPPPVEIHLNRVAVLPPPGGTTTTQTINEPLTEPPQPQFDLPKKLSPVYKQQILERFSKTDLNILKSGLDELSFALDQRSINNPVLWLEKVIQNLVTTEGGVRKKMIRESKKASKAI